MHSRRLVISSLHKVLVVDDDALVLHAMTDILERAGFEVLSRSSALGASRVIIKEGVDVVVLDVNMPSITGDRLLELFRRQQGTAHVPVVLVSACDSGELAEIARRTHASGYVSKSELSRRLAEVVARACPPAPKDGQVRP